MPATDPDPRALVPRPFAEAAATTALGKALHQGLDLPVSALRASLQALCRDHPRDAEAGVLLRGAIQEVERIEDNVHDLVAFAAPPEPRPLATTSAEVVGAALQTLRPLERARVRTSVASGRERLCLDATIACTALRRLVVNALEASTEDVLVLARAESGQGTVTFAVVNGPTPGFEPSWALAPFRTSKRGHLGLGLTLAARDAARLGGELVLERLHAGGTRAALRLPAEAAALPREEAA